uniref:ACB domain-containing protein n=1 Tax=Anopheles dirus TaxID=7168 RepID=A0A182NAF8_9DIPT
MNLEVDFKNALNKVRDIFMELSEEDQLFVYGLFKQSTAGDCILEHSEYILDYDVAKWEAWHSRMGMPQHEAKQAFVKKVAQIFELREEVKNG